MGVLRDECWSKAYHKDNYQVIGVCQEVEYNAAVFSLASVELFDVKDHKTPSINDSVRFLGMASEKFKADTESPLAVHCKAGRGRPGSLICVHWPKNCEWPKQKSMKSRHSMRISMW